MTDKDIRMAIKNMSIYLEECHDEDDTVTLTAKVLKSIKENYEELLAARAEIERLKEFEYMYNDLCK